MTSRWKKTVFFTSQKRVNFRKVRYKFTDPGAMRGSIGLGGQFELEQGIGGMLQPASTPTDCTSAYLLNGVAEWRIWPIQWNALTIDGQISVLSLPGGRGARLRDGTPEGFYMPYLTWERGGGAGYSPREPGIGCTWQHLLRLRYALPLTQD